MRAFPALVVLSSLVLVAREAAALELPELMERTKPSVVLVTVYDSAGHPFATGTGFCVSSDGRFVTNVHVVEHAARATLTMSDGKVVEVAGLLGQDPNADVAVLKAAGGAVPPVFQAGFQALPLGDSRTLVAGQEVVVVGSPEGLAGTLSTGIVAAIRDGGVVDPSGSVEDRPSFASWRIQITAPVSPGSSGSPVLTRDGLVVGVAVGKHIGENLNFCVPIELARALLDRLGDHPTLQPLARKTTWQELARNLGISAALFATCGFGYALLRRRWTKKPSRRPMVD